MTPRNRGSFQLDQPFSVGNYARFGSACPCSGLFNLMLNERRGQETVETNEASAKKPIRLLPLLTSSVFEEL
jgi:hypothetical protein